MRSHRRRGPLEHVLVASDHSELESVMALLAFLPEHAYGQVYVETPADRQLPPLPAPPRVTVTRLARPAGTAPGLLLAAAVDGWVSEWMPDDPDADRLVTLWCGGTVHDLVDPVAAPFERL
jgi:NADPH-dependent ferric siderophore reductase